MKIHLISKNHKCSRLKLLETLKVQQPSIATFFKLSKHKVENLKAKPFGY
jgi:hypothetical protein